MMEATPFFGGVIWNTWTSRWPQQGKRDWGSLLSQSTRWPEVSLSVPQPSNARASAMQSSIGQIGERVGYCDGW